MTSLIFKVVLLLLALLLLGLIIPAPAASDPFVPDSWQGTRDQYYEMGFVVIGGSIIAVIGVLILAVYPRGIILGLAGIILFWGITALVSLSHRDGGTAVIHHLR
jgi:hypothetical protein